MKKSTVLRKVFFLAVVAVLLVTAFTSCKKKEVVADGKYRIGFVVAGFDDVWHNLTATSTKRYVESQDPDMIVDLFDGKSKQEVRLQVLETISNSNYNYIVASVGDLDIQPQVDFLRTKNVPVLAYADSKEGRDDLYSTFVCNDYDLGLITAKRMAEELPRNAKVVYLDGPVYSGSILRRQGFQDGLLDKRPDVVLLDEQIANFVKSEAMEKMDDWIQRFGKIDGVMGANDQMALGAIESLRGNGYNIAETYIYGLDSVPDACLAIKAGELRFSSFQNPMSYATAFYERFKEHKEGKIDAFYTKNVAIEASYTDKSNVDELIEFYRQVGAIK
jgi:inositol transport system substrate-binding protein